MGLLLHSKDVCDINTMKFFNGSKPNYLYGILLRIISWLQKSCLFQYRSRNCNGSTPTFCKSHQKQFPPASAGGTVFLFVLLRALPSGSVKSGQCVGWLQHVQKCVAKLPRPNKNNVALLSRLFTGRTRLAVRAQSECVHCQLQLY